MWFTDSAPLVRRPQQDPLAAGAHRDERDLVGPRGEDNAADLAQGARAGEPRGGEEGALRVDAPAAALEVHLQEQGPEQIGDIAQTTLETILRFYEKRSEGASVREASNVLLAKDPAQIAVAAARLGTGEVIEALEAVAAEGTEGNEANSKGGASAYEFQFPTPHTTTITKDNNHREVKGEGTSLLASNEGALASEPPLAPEQQRPTFTSLREQSSSARGRTGDVSTGRRFSEATACSEATANEDPEETEETRVFGEILEKMTSEPTGCPSAADPKTVTKPRANESEAEAVSATCKDIDAGVGDGEPASCADAQADAEESKDEEDEVAALERRIDNLTRQVQELDLLPEGSLSLRAMETVKVELQKAKYERDQLLLARKNAGKKLAFNLIVVGCTGQGKSSSLNMLLNRNVCRVSGAQAQGTRGCQMNDGYISDDHFVSFIDTQGLGADTSVTDTELLSKIMMSTESISKLRIINNVLISFDTNTRATPATMANELTLMELFGEMRQSCFLVFTKWNTNAVQVEWNTPLRKWCRRWRRADTIEEITEDPPSYADMYAAYTRYILEAMNNDEDAGAFSKMGTFLSFFEARVVWAYNLDMLQIQDLEDGELEPHIVKLYHHYREKAIQCLRQGSTEVPVSQISFLKEDSDTLSRVATRLVEARDKKISQLEHIGLDVEKRKEMCNLFTDMAHTHCEKISAENYSAPPGDSTHMDQIASLAGFSPKSTQVGCTIS
ncbi:Immune-associated nucleotide-binding protein 7 [Hondaea fermentalgiana]|uniref:Immune-associated nucleotide-binding protein 7 n=1 Tax=Hondaea fermentalgiana TaxID=2315210 RepID=A0A2R5GD71_9STRA|nr:Immune-associated nucleotide-binding protein 7 [Hondaea fermentalgiana]|eukprot:GBG28930.1 Immune-associated nucleotide-binding protein 7 [Hondaea fermentalgiana]